MADRERGRVFVGYVRGEEESEHAAALMAQRLRESGFEVAEHISAATAAVVIVSPAAVRDEDLASRVAELVQRSGDEGGFRLVALPTMELDPHALPDSQLSALAGFEVPLGPSLEWRAQQVLWRLRDRSGAAKGEPEAQILGFDVGSTITALAGGEDHGRPCVVAGTRDGRVLRWTRSGEDWSADVIDSGPGPIRAVALAPRGPIGFVDGEGARHWHEQRVSVDEPHDAPATALAAAELGDRRLIASGHDDGVVAMWPVEGASPNLNEQVQISKRAVRALAVGAVEGRPAVLAGGADGALALAEFVPGAVVVGPWRGHDSVCAVAIATLDDRSVAVSSGDEGDISVRALPNGDEIARWSGVHGGAAIIALAVAEAEGEPIVVSAGADGHVRVTGLRDGTPRGAFAHAGIVRCVALVRDRGALLAFAGGDEQGLRIWEVGQALGAPAAQPEDERAEWIPDTPADTDLLGRAAVARHIGTRLERLRGERPAESFLVHVDGPWGSGKSTLLRLLADELGPGWLVVHFDAWRQMRVGPPWWALLASLRQALAGDAGAERLARLELRIAEAWQRAPRLYVLATAVLLALLATVLLAVPGIGLGGAEEIAGSVTALLVAVGALVGVATTVSRFLLWETAVGARIYEQANRDPMEGLADHFGWLTERAGKPVAFFVDDLDRCPPEYVVELLDSVQTLIRDVGARRQAEHATYVVVAADGRWIRNAYEHAHERSGAAVGEPGRPLGYLFLDKIFQLSIEVPPISPQRQDDFLGHLLRSSTEQASPAVAAEREEVRAQLRSTTTDSEAVAVHQHASPVVRAQLVEELVEKLAEPQVERATEHALRRFAPLLEPNPRAMKRFVNAFGLARALQLVQDVAVEREQLALWTVIRARWPALADYLRAHPDAIDALVEGRPPAKVPEALAPLFSSPEIAHVVRWEDGGPLTAASIRLCCGVSGGRSDDAVGQSLRGPRAS